MSLSRTTALIKKGACAAGVCIAALSAFAALGTTSALAWHGYGQYGYNNELAGRQASAQKNNELAVCQGQTFSQPFEAYGDDNYYTLVEGSEFNSGVEGWELKNGAEVVEGTRPDGSAGGVLDLPAGAYAVSPPECVTLHYPTARTWVEAVQGGGLLGNVLSGNGVLVGVYYPGAKFGATGLPVATVGAKPGKGWELSSPFDVIPQLGGLEEGVREVRFVFANVGRASGYRLSGLYVDPRMS
jgi:hypothetical protein